MKHACFAALLLAGGCGGGGETPPMPPPTPLAAPASSSTTLGVEERSNATPSIASHGEIVAVAWGATDGGRTDVVVAMSRDGGVRFDAPVVVDGSGTARLGGEFPPRVAVRVPAGGDAARAEVTVVWTARDGRGTEILTAASRDGGRSFERPRALQKPGAAGARGWPALALDARGAAHAVWLDHRGLAASSGHAHGHDSSAQPAADGAARALKSGIYYAPLDGASGGERELAPGVCYCCKTAMAGGADGALYAAWRHVYPGNLRDMAFAVSRDGGRTFGAPVRVSEDGWKIDGCPDDGPAIAVDAQNRVHVVWPTVVDGQDPRGAIFYAASRDGRGFEPRIEVPTLGSVKPSHAQIVATDDGVAIAWDEHRDDRRVAAVRLAWRDRSGRMTFSRAIELGTTRMANYPMLAAAGGKIVVVSANGGEGARLDIRTVPLTEFVPERGPNPAAPRSAR